MTNNVNSCRWRSDPTSRDPRTPPPCSRATRTASRGSRPPRRPQRPPLETCPGRPTWRGPPTTRPTSPRCKATRRRWRPPRPSWRPPWHLHRHLLPRLCPQGGPSEDSGLKRSWFALLDGNSESFKNLKKKLPRNCPKNSWKWHKYKLLENLKSLKDKPINP